MATLYCPAGTGAAGVQAVVAGNPVLGGSISLCTDLLPGFYVSTAVAGGVDVAGFIVACPVALYAPACPGVLGLFTEKWDAASVTLISASGDDREVTVAMFSLQFPAPTSVATGGRPFCTPNVVNGVATDEREDYVFFTDAVSITGCVSPAPTAGTELARCASACVGLSCGGGRTWRLVEQCCVCVRSDTSVVAVGATTQCLETHLPPAITL
jgi:hypothetical protein